MSRDWEWEKAEGRGEDKKEEKKVGTQTNPEFEKSEGEEGEKGGKLWRNGW